MEESLHLTAPIYPSLSSQPRKEAAWEAAERYLLSWAASAEHSSWGSCRTQGLGSQAHLLVNERPFLDHTVMNRSRAMFMHQMIQFGPIQ